MTGMAPHHQREGTHTSWPEDIGVGGGLSTTLQRALMDRTQFIHMVALVRARSGIHEGEHTGNEQRTLVVSHREWTGKDGARLTVLSLTVAEEERIGG